MNLHILIMLLLSMISILLTPVKCSFWPRVTSTLCFVTVLGYGDSPALSEPQVFPSPPTPSPSFVASPLPILSLPRLNDTSGNSAHPCRPQCDLMPIGLPEMAGFSQRHRNFGRGEDAIFRDCGILDAHSDESVPIPYRFCRNEPLKDSLCCHKDGKCNMPCLKSSPPPRSDSRQGFSDEYTNVDHPFLSFAAKAGELISCGVILIAVSLFYLVVLALVVPFWTFDFLVSTTIPLIAVLFMLLALSVYHIIVVRRLQRQLIFAVYGLSLAQSGQASKGATDGHGGPQSDMGHGQADSHSGPAENMPQGIAEREKTNEPLDGTFAAPASGSDLVSAPAHPEETSPSQTEHDKRSEDNVLEVNDSEPTGSEPASKHPEPDSHSDTVQDVAEDVSSNDGSKSAGHTLHRTSETLAKDEGHSSRQASKAAAKKSSTKTSIATQNRFAVLVPEDDGSSDEEEPSATAPVDVPAVEKLETSLLEAIDPSDTALAEALSSLDEGTKKVFRHRRLSRMPLDQIKGLTKNLFLFMEYQEPKWRTLHTDPEARDFLGHWDQSSLPRRLADMSYDQLCDLTRADFEYLVQRQPDWKDHNRDPLAKNFVGHWDQGGKSLFLPGYSASDLGEADQKWPASAQSQAGAQSVKKRPTASRAPPVVPSSAGPSVSSSSAEPRRGVLPGAAPINSEFAQHIPAQRIRRSWRE